MRKIWLLINAHFVIFLVLVVLVSYGQMLWMYPWQDDNALFFKLAHIDEPAGYFGIGPVGNGLTKWAHTPFIPIYYLFGHNTVFYFAFLLVLYLLSTLMVYKTFSVILGESGGRIAGFLYGAGYIISDGVWRMANSATTSFSVIFIGLFLIGYWKFYKSKNLIWYLQALLAFFLASEITIVRTHYFFLIVVLFELIFLSLKKLPFSFIFSLIRLIPFFYIFNNWALTASSSRTGEARDFVFAIFEGQFHLYYGFLSSVANLVVPDWLTSYLFAIQRWVDLAFQTHIPILRLTLLLLPALIIFMALRDSKFGKILIPLFLVINTFWVLISKQLFVAPLLSPSIEQSFTATLGGSVLLLAMAGFFILGKIRWVFLFLALWLLANISVYSAYNPAFQYGTVERYLTHSFVALVGIFGILFINFSKKGFWGRLGKLVIIFLGSGNLINAVLYENTILFERSLPAKEFYNQLKTLRPEIKRGDVLYFDIAHDAQRYYNDAISTAQMPETTAFAWRYGIDRYDIKLTNDFGELLNIVKTDKIPLGNAQTFWYSRDGLIDTSKQVTDFLKGASNLSHNFPNLSKNSNVLFQKGAIGTVWDQPDVDVAFDKVLPSMAPLKITLGIKASASTTDLGFPLTWGKANLTGREREFFNSKGMRSLAIEYKRSKNELLSVSKYAVSSEWQGNIAENLHDGDIESLWQSERTGWGREFTFIGVEMPGTIEVDRVVWINGFSHNTPSRYSIEISIDGANWRTVKEINLAQRIDNREPQVISFEPVSARFIRMVLKETLNGDSPVVAEFWPVPSKFSGLDIKLAEQFLENPLAFVPSKRSLLDTINNLEGIGSAQLFWESDKRGGWQTTKNAEFDIYYDGKPRTYSLIIPAGGTRISKIKVANITIPGTLNLNSVNLSYPAQKELK